MQNASITQPDCVSEPWPGVWRRVGRPLHFAAVHAFRMACERVDAVALVSMLNPDIAVVVDDSDLEQPKIRVAWGFAEAIPLLFYGLADQAGLVIAERSVNSQPGLMLRRGVEDIANICIDFTGTRISVVWIRLHPEALRHWNHI